MKRLRIILLANSLALAVAGAAVAQSAAPAPSKDPAAGKMMTLQMPALPDPVAVTLPSATTAVFVADMIDRTCGPQPSCTGQMEPAIAALLAKARKAGVYVVYSKPSGVTSGVLPAVAPAQGDPIIDGHGQDRFYNTDLDAMLKAKGIKNLILTGWKVSGSVVYTSVGATLRGYTVVVPEDASLAATDYDIAIGRYQILTQNAANASNEPLKPQTSTLSRTDMITFK
ncbi:MAG TPA: isochorismatase family protein [Beijerinckiaceae bacterium]|nr:isochorismatase family protein [Beijerinckiaceae bacterium]